MASIGLLSLLTPKARADAPGEHVRLVWVRGEGAETCGAEATVAAHVAARLGRDPFAEDAPHVIEAFVKHDAGAWSARIEVRDLSGKPLGERELTSDAKDCAPIESAVTFALALAIDPEAALRPEPVEPPPPAPAPPPPAPLPLPNPCPLAAPCPHSSPTRVVAVARAGAGVGFVPGVASGFGLSVDVKPRGRLSVSAGALWFPESHTPARDFAFGLTAAFAGGCVDALAWSRGALSACASFYGGEIQAVTFTLDPTGPGGRLWLAISGSAKLSLIVAGPLVLAVGVEAVPPLLRYRFKIEGTSNLAYQESVVPLFGSLSLGVSLP